VFAGFQSWDYELSCTLVLDDALPFPLCQSTWDTQPHEISGGRGRTST
jgi:hypothetical protein